MTFAIILVVIVAVVFIGAFVESFRKKRPSASGSVDHRVEMGNTRGHEYRPPPNPPGGLNGP